jgi:hypothetical protein
MKLKGRVEPQCWVGLSFFRDPPGPGFRSFCDTRLGFFFFLICLTDLGRFSKTLNKNSARFQSAGSQTVHISQFSNMALRQWVSKILFIQNKTKIYKKFRSSKVHFNFFFPKKNKYILHKLCKKFTSPKVHQVQKNLQNFLTHPQKSKSLSISSIKLEGGLQSILRSFG